jgi:hypothetical protein
VIRRVGNARVSFETWSLKASRLQGVGARSGCSAGSRRPATTAPSSARSAMSALLDELDGFDGWLVIEQDWVSQPGDDAEEQIAAQGRNRAFVG